MRRTKIVATLGPATDTPAVLRQVLRAGADVVRLNLSHGTHADHRRRIRAVRRLAKAFDRPIAILLDLGGVKPRLGDLANGPVRVAAGDTVTFTAGPARDGDIPFPDLAAAGLRAGARFLVADGALAFRVQRRAGPRLIARAQNDGELSSRMGVYLPDAVRAPRAFTAKDRRDLRFGLEEGVDWVAMSFVRSAADIRQVQRAIARAGARTPVIAKIENREACEHLDDLIAAADGVMVARGDLGIAVGFERVPLLQKRMIAVANRLGKPVITATQMLESMTMNPQPTRAEASDVANAILDGTDAVMLSAETAKGCYPVEAVRAMARIVTGTERHIEHTAPRHDHADASITEAICRATVDVAHHLQAKAILTATTSGFTARMVSRFRPRQPILALTHSDAVRRRLALCWGVDALLAPRTTDADTVLRNARAAARRRLRLRRGDRIVVTTGWPIGTPGTTNLVQVSTLE